MQGSISTNAMRGSRVLRSCAGPLLLRSVPLSSLLLLANYSLGPAITIHYPQSLRIPSYWLFICSNYTDYSVQIPRQWRLVAIFDEAHRVVLNAREPCLAPSGWPVNCLSASPWVGSLSLLIKVIADWVCQVSWMARGETDGEDRWCIVAN